VLSFLTMLAVATTGTVDAPVATPTALPHYVGLDPLAQAQLDRLTDELAEADKLMAAHKLASTRVLLDRARREADAAANQLLVLKLYPSWTEAITRLEEHARRLSDAWAKGPDPESVQLATAAVQRLEATLGPLERELDHLGKEPATRRLRAARQAVDEVALDPLLRGNPAWQGPAAALERRLARLEQRLAKIQVAGTDTSRTGRRCMGEVDHWLLDAKRRDQLVAEARDPWRKALTGDRLRLYGMYGVPTWPGAPADPAPAEAVAQDLWIFYEQAPKGRLRHEYHFVGDHLQHHELFKE